jgi:hypothetical protein
MANCLNRTNEIGSSDSGESKSMPRESVHRNHQPQKSYWLPDRVSLQRRAFSRVLNNPSEHADMQSQREEGEQKRIHTSLVHIRSMGVTGLTPARQVQKTGSALPKNEHNQPHTDKGVGKGEQVKVIQQWGGAKKQEAKSIAEQFPDLSGRTTGTVGGRTGTFTAQQPQHLREGNKEVASPVIPPLFQQKTWPVEAIVERVRNWNQLKQDGEMQLGLSMEAWGKIKAELGKDKTKANQPKYNFIEGEGSGMYAGYMQVKIIGRNDLAGGKKATYHIAYEKLA